MIRSLATLARWLGPWADASRAPAVVISDQRVGDMRVRLYGTPRRSTAGTSAWPAAPPKSGAVPSTFLIAPGLHYAGADDPRMDRFCRILAAAGHLVVAPFVPDFLALTPNARAIADFRRAYDALPRWSDARPVVFSISFGSLLAFALAADVEVERLVVFGGYKDIAETLRFCLTGRVSSGRTAARDPLNQAVILLNLIDHLTGHLTGHLARDDRVALAAAWRRYVEAVWGRPEMKARARYVAVAERLAPEVPDAVRELFLVGVGARPGAWELAQPALAQFDTAARDPSPYLPRIRGRVELVHGVDDDVIPFEQSHALAAALTAADVRVHITGMYGHTGAQAPRLGDAARELVTMLRVLRVLAG